MESLLDQAIAIIMHMLFQYAIIIWKITENQQACGVLKDIKIDMQLTIYSLYEIP